MQLNDNAAVKQALEITKLAIEHNYVRKGHTSEEAAKNTYEYYETLVSLFTGSKEQADQ